MLEKAPHRFRNLDIELQERITEAAVAEFACHGYVSASMNKVVRQAGISKGALFKYFGTKAGLFQNIYRSVLRKVKEPLKEARDLSAGDPFFSRLEKVIAAGLGMTDRYPHYAAIYYRVIYTGDAPHSRRLAEEIRDEGARFLESLIRDGMAAGQLRDDLDPGRAAFILQSVLDRFLHERYRSRGTSAGGREDETQLWIREITAIFQKGLENGREVRDR